MDFHVICGVVWVLHMVLILLNEMTQLLVSFENAFFSMKNKARFRARLGTLQRWAEG